MNHRVLQEWRDGVTLQDVVDLIRRVWRRALLGGLVTMLLGIVVGFLRPKSYVARASFIAEQTRMASLPSGLGALASQFGFDVAGEAGRSPQFYRELVMTSGLLLSVLDSVVPVTGKESLTVRGLIQGTVDTSLPNTDRVLQRMRKMIAADADARTSIVALSVRARTPATAERIANLLIGALKHFNVSTRQLQAKQRRQFLEGRVADALQTLRNSEENLQRFYERNRRFVESPTLVFEESRMKRAVDLQQDLYTTLSKELETSRIQEVNDTPAITIIDPPFASSRPSGPRVPIVAAFFFVLGLSLVGIWIIAIAPKDRQATGHVANKIG